MSFQAEQTIIGANEDGTPTGEYFSRLIGHTGGGKKHFAISVLLINKKGENLLQKRKHRIFDNLWDTTASTHQIHFEDGRNETDEEATDRSLEAEYRIKPGSITYQNFGGINYFAKYEDGFCENEHDIILVGEYDGEFKLNPDEGYDCKWVDKQTFLKDIKENPKEYTPWAIEAVKLLEQKGFFN